MPVQTVIKLRRDTAANWASTNPTLAAGEQGYETDTGKIKIGNGSTAWTSLSYSNPGGAIAQSQVTNLTTDLTAKAPISSPTFTGTVAGITKAMVGLANVDNTSDANKPVSTAAQTALNLKANIASPTFTGTVTLAQSPTSDLEAATKLYVDNVAAGINFHEAVHAASISNLSVVYNNGASGVGATLTADTNRAFAVLDGESVVVGQRVLIKDQTDQKQNGIYTLTSVGSGSSPWVLTRATDSDNNPAGELKAGDFCFVINGATNAGFGFVNNSTASPIVIGTSNITYTEFNAAKTIVAGNGLQESTPGTLSIDTTITQTRVSGVSDTEIGYLDGVTSAIQTQLNAKAPTANPTFTGTVSGVTKAHVGLGNVDNTSDANKPVSSATQTALDAKVSNSNYSAKGVILVGTGNGTFVAQTVGTNGQVLTANSSLSDGVEWTTPATGGASTSGTLAQFAATTSSQLAGVISDETGSGALVFGTSPTVSFATLRSPKEITTVSATAATGTINYDQQTQADLFYTSNASANFTLNFRGSSSVTLNNSMATGETATLVFRNTNGTTPYYPTAFSIDGTSVTPRWLGGTAPAAGNASSIDVYSFVITKTGSATFTVLASVSRFA